MSKTGQGNKKKLAVAFSKPWVIILCLILFPPLGIFLVWKQSWPAQRKLKIAVTIISSILLIAYIGSYAADRAAHPENYAGTPEYEQKQEEERQQREAEKQRKEEEKKQKAEEEQRKKEEEKQRIEEEKKQKEAEEKQKKEEAEKNAIVLSGNDLGQYGKQVVLHDSTGAIADTRNEFAVPAGTYKVINVGKYGMQLDVVFDAITIEDGNETQKWVFNPIVLKAGDETQIDIADGELIELETNETIKLIKQ